MAGFWESGGDPDRTARPCSVCAGGCDLLWRDVLYACLFRGGGLHVPAAGGRKLWGFYQKESKAAVGALSGKQCIFMAVFLGERFASYGKSCGSEMAVCLWDLLFQKSDVYSELSKGKSGTVGCAKCAALVFDGVVFDLSVV